MDETCINVKGEGKYLYRAVDAAGHTVDFLLIARRNVPAALSLCFFRKAIRRQGEPEGQHGCAVHAQRQKARRRIITVRQSKYLNNLIEQDHRNIKRRIRPMREFKSFRRTQTILAGIG
jgi:transposase-like protein